MPLFKAKGPRKLTALTKGVIKKNLSAASTVRQLNEFRRRKCGEHTRGRRQLKSYHPNRPHDRRLINSSSKCYLSFVQYIGI